jgi:DNA-binding CsgD family transcriptional regulator/PAS domain-containing protein
MTKAISSQALSELIGSIYDSALDPDHWDQTLSDLRDAYRGQATALFLTDRRDGRVLIWKNVGVRPGEFEEQGRHFPEANAGQAKFIEENSLDKLMVLSRAARESDWETSPYLRSLRKLGYIDSIAHFLIWGPDHASQFGAARVEGQGCFTERDLALGDLLLPHLRRAVTISKVLDARAIERDRMAETLNALKCGVFLTKQNGAILHANRAAERMMRHGGSIQSFRGVMQAKAPAAADELRAAIALAARDETALGKTGLAIRLSDDDAPPQFAHVLPLAHGEQRARLKPDAVAAVFVGAGLDEEEGAEAMAGAFGLTCAETRLIESLLAGRSLKESAVALGIAMTTAKTHLDNIFQKTGVNRQAELMRLAASAASPARHRLVDPAAVPGS